MKIVIKCLYYYLILLSIIFIINLNLFKIEIIFFSHSTSIITRPHGWWVWLLLIQYLGVGLGKGGLVLLTQCVVVYIECVRVICGVCILDRD